MLLRVTDLALEVLRTFALNSFAETPTDSGWLDYRLQHL
jgi:hypothetical protein